MKKVLTTLSIVALAATSIKAQEATKKSKSYLRVGAGYAFPHGGNTYTKRNYSTTTVQTIETKKFSLGAGINATIALGTWINTHIGLELGINVGVLGKKYKIEYGEPYGGGYYNTFYSKMPVYAMPAVILQTNGKKLNIYSRVGLVINVAGKVMDEYDGNGVKQVAELKFKTGLGFQGGLGVVVPISKKLNFFVEANGISINQYLKKSEITEATSRGVGVLDFIPINERITEYEKDLTIQTTVPSAPDKPTKEVTYSLPFSNVGLSAGIVLKF